MRDGRVTGVLCSGCQTPEENIEAVINLATTAYFADEEGRLRGRPKSPAEPS